MKLSDHIRRTKMGRPHLTDAVRHRRATEEVMGRKEPRPMPASAAPYRLHLTEEVKEPASVASQSRAEERLPSSATGKKASFRLSDFIRKKFATPKERLATPKERFATPKEWPAAPVPDLSAVVRHRRTTEEAMGKDGQRWVPPLAEPVEEEPAPIESPLKAEVPSEAVTEHSFMLTDHIRQKRAAAGAEPQRITTFPAPPPVQPAEDHAQRVVKEKLVPPEAGSTPAKASAALPIKIGTAKDRSEAQTADEPAQAKTTGPAEGRISRFDAQPATIYDIARQLGIALPQSRKAAIDKAESCLHMIFRKIIHPSAGEKMIWPMIKSIAADIKGIISDDPVLLTILHRHRVKRERLVWHSLYTAILAMDMALHESGLECSIDEIGGAALLHDAGLLLQTNGYDTVIDRNFPDLSDHVAKGVKLARAVEVPDAALTLIAQHHGRLDGKGYPPGLTSKTFLRGSQIVAIASIFEHITLDIFMEKKEGLSEETRENGIPQAFNEYRNAFSRDLLKKMIALIGFYPAGSVVELNNRAICEVVSQNNDFPIRPVVKVIMDSAGNHPEAEQVIDLKQIKVLSIVRSVASPKTV